MAGVWYIVHISLSQGEWAWREFHCQRPFDGLTLMSWIGLCDHVTKKWVLYRGECDWEYGGDTGEHGYIIKSETYSYMFQGGHSSNRTILI
jgi:hypothetical protein